MKRALPIPAAKTVIPKPLGSVRECSSVSAASFIPFGTLNVVATGVRIGAVVAGGAADLADPPQAASRIASTPSQRAKPALRLCIVIPPDGTWSIGPFSIEYG